MNINSSKRPIVVIANSSKYILHYRSLLIKTIKKEHDLVLIAPFDASSKLLSKFNSLIIWEVKRKRDINFLSLLTSFIGIFKIVYKIKPKLIHSHTLKTNLLLVIVSSLLGIPCILSFAGLGTLLNTKGTSKLILPIVLKTIALFALIDFNRILKLKMNKDKTHFIFQNDIDLNFFKKNVPNFPDKNINLIVGSGIPDNYLNKSKQIKKNKNQWSSNTQEKELIKIDFIYSARLLKSKGIKIFLKLSSLFKNHNFFVFGEIDKAKKDSLNDEEIYYFKSKYPNVRFMGYVQDPFLSKEFKFPVLIFPSTYGEGFPRSIGEAFAIKIPVICSKKSSLTISILKEFTYIPKENDVKSYLRCVNRLIEDYKKGKLEKMLKDAQSKVINELSEQSIVEQTLAVYRKIN